ncbi:hypothetical protein CTZ27_24970 [Streptomyces griseocarneus]|nr:hypothetical protein CTZ27_24970 [Streptomyces griseocarneus]
MLNPAQDLENDVIQVGDTTMPAAGPLDPYQRRLVELGTAIKEHRLAKGWTQRGLAKAIALDHTTVSGFETGRVPPRRDVARRIDDALEARGVIFRLRDELDDNPDSPSFQRLLKGQRQAKVIWQIAMACLPPMLETDEVARVILEAGIPLYGGSLDDKIFYRANMRAILRQRNAPTLRVVMWAPVLQNQLGGRSVMRAQLLHLAEMAQAPNIDLRILPLEGVNFIADVGFVTIWDHPRQHPTAWRPSGRQGVFVRKQSEVDELISLYDHLRNLALDPEASKDLIIKAVEEYYPCAPLTLTCP